MANGDITGGFAQGGRFHRIYTDVNFCNFLNKIPYRESVLIVLDWFVLIKSNNLFCQAKKNILGPSGRIFHIQMSTRDN